jgi:AraC-like DNA-binding protein
LQVSKAPVGEKISDGLVPVQTFTTAHLPPDERYVAWRNRDWPKSEHVFRTEPFEPFDTYWESAPLGPLLFLYTEITGMRWERRRQSIRTSSFDSIIVNMMIEGSAEGDLGGRAFRETAGCLHFHDLGRPSLHVSSASRTYSVILPRPLAEQWLAPLASVHGLVIEPPDSEMLMSQAREVHRMLHRLTLPTAERLGRVFLELLAAAAADHRERTAPPGRSAVLRARAEEEIERLLGSPRITSEMLCSRLGVSRAALFEAFDEEGGVQKYALGVRLERVRAALADLERNEPVGDIAFRFGFSDASHLSRSFRARFGMSPRDYRRLVQRDETEGAG